MEKAGDHGLIISRLFGVRDFGLGLALLNLLYNPNDVLLKGLLQFTCAMDFIDFGSYSIAYSRKSIDNISYVLGGVGALAFALIEAYALKKNF